MIAERDRPGARSWRPPTRRAFVQMLAAATAVIALGDKPLPQAMPVWIGHF